MQNAKFISINIDIWNLSCFTNALGNFYSFLISPYIKEKANADFTYSFLNLQSWKSVMRQVWGMGAVPGSTRNLYKWEIQNSISPNSLGHPAPICVHLYTQKLALCVYRYTKSQFIATLGGQGPIHLRLENYLGIDAKF